MWGQYSVVGVEMRFRGDASGASRSHELIVTLRLKETDSLLPLKHSLSPDMAMVNVFG